MIKTKGKNILMLSLKELQQHAYNLEVELMDKDAQLEDIQKILNK